MKCIEKKIVYPSRSDTIRLVVFSDIHLGNRHCDEKLLKKTIESVKDDPRAYWLDMGDGCEWINRRDPRFDPDELPVWLLGELKDLARAQRKKRVSLFRPIGDRCLAMVEGNHERDILHHAERDVYTTVAEGIGAENVCLGPSGFLRIIFERAKSHSCWTLTLFLTHGWWGGRLMGAGALNLERIAGWVDADVILAGHDHRRRVFSLQKLAPRKNCEVETKTVYCVSCGSYLHQPAYAQAKGFRPTEVGSVELLIRPDRRQVRVVI